jgi:hypothetical protein
MPHITNPESRAPPDMIKKADPTPDKDLKTHKPYAKKARHAHHKK